MLRAQVVTAVAVLHNAFHEPLRFELRRAPLPQRHGFVRGGGAALSDVEDDDDVDGDDDDAAGVAVAATGLGTWEVTPARGSVAPGGDVRVVLRYSVRSPRPLSRYTCAAAHGGGGGDVRVCVCACVGVQVRTPARGSAEDARVSWSQRIGWDGHRVQLRNLTTGHVDARVVMRGGPAFPELRVAPLLSTGRVVWFGPRQVNATAWTRLRVSNAGTGLLRVRCAVDAVPAVLADCPFALCLPDDGSGASRGASWEWTRGACRCIVPCLSSVARAG